MTVESDLLRSLLGSTVIAVVVTTSVQLIIKMSENRNRLKAERAASLAISDARLAQWNADYRAHAETHLPWDYEIRSRTIQSEALINELREALNMPPIAFLPIPPPPPLFPKFPTTP